MASKKKLAVGAGTLFILAAGLATCEKSGGFGGAVPGGGIIPGGGGGGGGGGTRCVFNDTNNGNPAANMSFFVTSTGVGNQGGNFGGLFGADAHCQRLATAVGVGGTVWRAYLSTDNPRIDARDRIGNGPWVNFAGQTVATDVNALHTNPPAGALLTTERGNVFPNCRHDVLTGSSTAGTVLPGQTCDDWTSNDGATQGFVGHTNWDALTNNDENPNSRAWNGSHLVLCSEPELVAFLGVGALYCFSTGQTFIMPDAGPQPDATPMPEDTGVARVANANMSFFVSSIGNGANGGNFGGLAGADQFCQTLGDAALNTQKTWRAYLSTTAQAARDRIGTGPWFNFDGAMIATSVDTLHTNGPASNLILTEQGDEVLASEHDVLTGSNTDGRAFTDAASLMPRYNYPSSAYTASTIDVPSNCDDWTNDGSANTATNWVDFGVVGHVDWDSAAVGTHSRSWNSSHVTGCDESAQTLDLGRARIYCFATN